MNTNALRLDTGTSSFINHKEYQELIVNYDADQRALWGFMQGKPRPCFTPNLLHEIQDLLTLVAHNDQSEIPIDYLVAASSVPGIYNLGGDLAYFRDCIEKQDRERLREYGYACLEVGYACSTQVENGVTSIALVQGQALGGGFEGALSCNVIIAEETATFGFPEILFNLFPGMGAHSYLMRRVPPYLAKRMITSGNKYTAKELYDMGVIDVLAKEGEGISTTQEFIRQNRSRRRAHQAIECANLRVNPISLEELRDVNDIWVDAAMEIDPQAIRTMERLTRAQSRLFKQGEVEKN